MDTEIGKGCQTQSFARQQEGLPDARELAVAAVARSRARRALGLSRGWLSVANGDQSGLCEGDLRSKRRHRPIRAQSGPCLEMWLGSILNNEFGPILRDASPNLGSAIAVPDLAALGVEKKSSLAGQELGKLESGPRLGFELGFLRDGHLKEAKGAQRARHPGPSLPNRVARPVPSAQQQSR